MVNRAYARWCGLKMLVRRHHAGFQDAQQLLEEGQILLMVGDVVEQHVQHDPEDARVADGVTQRQDRRTTAS